MKKKLFSLLAAGALALCALTPTAYALTPALDIISDTYCVMDAASGQVLIEKGMNKQKAPASITKILTVALALERGGNPDDRFVLDYKTCHSIEAGSTHIALTEEEEISLRDALMATMIMSANDAANAVAQYSAGDMDSFIPLMNQKLQEIGAKDTQFMNPNGLDQKGHYTTAYDMCLITQWAMGVEGFDEYYGALSYEMAPTNKQPQARPFSTRHNMLLKTMKYYYDGAVGGKLGYTYDARHTIVTTAKRGDMTLICVAMDSPTTYDKYKDSTKLLDYCFDNFGTLSLRAKNIQDFAVPILDHSGQQVGVAKIQAEEDVDLLVSKGTEIQDLVFSYNIPESYLSGQEIAPVLTIQDKNGVQLYQGPMGYTVGQTTAANQNTYQGQTFVYPFQENALLILKWGGVVLGVLVLALFIARFFIRRHYRKVQEERRRRQLAAQKRRQAALRKQKATQRQKTTPQQTPAATYGNVTYLPSSRQGPWSSAGGGNR
jgi:D-alanyl-D-alanine carboxypeptidase